MLCVKLVLGPLWALTARKFWKAGQTFCPAATTTKSLHLATFTRSYWRWESAQGQESCSPPMLALGSRIRKGWRKVGEWKYGEILLLNLSSRSKRERGMLLFTGPRIILTDCQDLNCLLHYFIRSPRAHELVLWLLPCFDIPTVLRKGITARTHRVWVQWGSEEWRVK